MPVCTWVLVTAPWAIYASLVRSLIEVSCSEVLVVDDLGRMGRRVPRLGSKGLWYRVEGLYGLRSNGRRGYCESLKHRDALGMSARLQGLWCRACLD